MKVPAAMRAKILEMAGLSDDAGPGPLDDLIGRRLVELPDATSHGHARFSLEVVGWHPTTLNVLINSHHMEAHRRKRIDAGLIAVECLRAGVTRASGRRRVSLTVVLAPRQRGGDPDCYWKSLLDGLARAGAIRDDNRQWLDLGPVAYIRAETRATRIVIEDIEGGD